MHTHRERRLRARRCCAMAGEGLAVIGVPWQLQPPAPRKLLAEEEPAAALEEVK